MLFNILIDIILIKSRLLLRRAEKLVLMNFTYFVDVDII
jgi:hypothetical protein